MKRILLTMLAVSTVFQAKAELFSPESLAGGAIGAVAGAIIGHNNNRHGGEGALIGAGAGLVFGSIVAKKREQKIYYASQPVTHSQPQSAPQPQAQPQVENNWPKHGPNNTTYFWTRPPDSLLQN